MSFDVKKQISSVVSISYPSDDSLVNICTLLTKQVQSERIHRRYAPVKHILTFLGLVGIVGLTLIAPQVGIAAKPFINFQRKKEFEKWKEYNPSYLRTSIRRLHKQKLVEIFWQDGEEVVILTKSGKKRILKYAIEDLKIEEPKAWDNEWRIIIYDVNQKKKHLRDIFRSSLKMLGFLQLQESVWIYPYPCEQQISFLKEYYGVGNEVVYVVARKLEDDSPYREYFGLFS